MQTLISDYLKGIEIRKSLTAIVKETEFNKCQVKAILKATEIPYEEKNYSPIGTTKVLTYKNYDFVYFQTIVKKLIEEDELEEIIRGF